MASIISKRSSLDGRPAYTKRVPLLKLKKKKTCKSEQLNPCLLQLGILRPKGTRREVKGLAQGHRSVSGDISTGTPGPQALCPRSLLPVSYLPSQTYIDA